MTCFIRVNNLYRVIKVIPGVKHLSLGVKDWGVPSPQRTHGGAIKTSLTSYGPVTQSSNHLNKDCIQMKNYKCYYSTVYRSL